MSRPPFTVPVSAAVIESAVLPDRAVFLYALARLRAGRSGTVAELPLAERYDGSGISRATFWRAMADLRRAGLLERVSELATPGQWAVDDPGGRYARVPGHWLHVGTITAGRNVAHINLKCVRVLLVYAAAADKGGTVQLTPRTVAARASCKVRTVERARGQLRNLGLIVTGSRYGTVLPDLDLMQLLD